MTQQLSVETTPIPGLLVVHLPVHGDSRGWFKENWQRAKMTALGLPDFGPVQNNVSYNATRGATRGIHTEPWDKYVAVATGRVFAAWVDMREGDSFGTTFWIEIDESVAVFVPRGVGNSYQALEDGTTYTYLVNDHYVPGRTYPALHLGDESSAIPWPIPLAEAEISAKDQGNPRLADVTPMQPRRALVVGARGQLGRALQAVFPGADLVDLGEPGDGVERLDLTDADAVAAWPWNDYDVVLNAAAYTAVDAAETPEGRVVCWAANATAPATLARLAAEHRFTLVHVSSDYVFDGTHPLHPEDERLSPLGVYGQAKAAGDLAVGTAPRHYLLRTSWVIGDGKNFVRTMQTLAGNGVTPTVVDDQRGRLTFTSELARAVRHLVDTGAPYGTYNVTGGGDVLSWADYAKRVYELAGRSADDVTPITTEEYEAGKTLAPRPRNSALDLAKVEATGFVPRDALEQLEEYVTSADA
ncbi:sugar nucleotide-binding protein [Nocardioides sp. ChNu-153]|uniref:bifunctional dTDP-4-dehydrorhamnose 3,5-epimerase family protein/NAD(P)-dependent oxidoreductase n=1 Tax=unclassified Nocardioides TaxID=2615069 RepID=UPI0024058C02|nr:MULTISPECIES: bifunctional dTDP-4-dehydrorhamnose 3,5-epimerase family protein/NAD(P)-dependent oxidoreductase [unclassified Nocardioides]MDF9715009.1 bifunctional dTDP-4-dehydrorhamnose 3,5-epimerase family protein/NAD(P)-dependent oxidoreductase [Nocardioides sp. ChNu-99]MDN7122278.1 sugar nucleotide-binding protein [Nocardioides sp. ChNu-153]